MNNTIKIKGVEYIEFKPGCYVNKRDMVLSLHRANKKKKLSNK